MEDDEIKEQCLNIFNALSRRLEQCAEDLSYWRMTLDKKGIEDQLHFDLELLPKLKKYSENLVSDNEKSQIALSTTDSESNTNKTPKPDQNYIELSKIISGELKKNNKKINARNKNLQNNRYFIEEYGLFDPGSISTIPNITGNNLEKLERACISASYTLRTWYMEKNTPSDFCIPILYANNLLSASNKACGHLEAKLHYQIISNLGNKAKTKKMDEKVHLISSLIMESEGGRSNAFLEKAKKLTGVNSINSINNYIEKAFEKGLITEEKYLMVRSKDYEKRTRRSED